MVLLSRRLTGRWFAVALTATAIALLAVVAALVLGRPSDDGPPQAGALDESFGEAGIARTAPVPVDPTTFVRLADGRIVAVGVALFRGRRSFALVAYRPDGALDTGFGGDGVVRTRIGTYAAATAAAARPDGGFVVAGCASSLPGAHGCGDMLALAAYRPDGSLDRRFGERGVVTTSFPRAVPEPPALAVQPDGRIVVAGRLFCELATRDSRCAVSESAILVLRYRAGGSLDPSFGREGVVLVRVPDAKGLADVSEVALQADGKIVLGESAEFSVRSDGFRLIRLRRDGMVDRSFGDDGRAHVILSTTSPCCSILGALLPLPDGRTIAVGQDSEEKRRMALVRFTASGAIDRSFGGDGIVVVGRREDAWAHLVEAFSLERGKILAAGWANVGPRPRPRAHYVLLRLTEAGALDRSFGEDGRVSTLTGVSAMAAFLEGRRLTVAGAADALVPQDVVFARYHVR